MDKNKLVKCMRLLTFGEVKDEDWSEFLEQKLEEIYKILQISYEDTSATLINKTVYNFSDIITPEWNYICLGFYIINKLFDLKIKNPDEAFLSVQETKDFKKYLRNIINIGICTKLQPNLPFYVKSKFPERSDVFWNYNMLKCTTFGLTEYLKIPILRFLIIPEGLKEILVSLYQISYCPLKKPDSATMMTQEIYEKLLEDQQFFIKILDHLNQTVHPNIFVKDTMIILHKNSPIWFKKQVSQTLTNILRSKNGVELVAVALFGDHQNDSTQICKISDVFSKLILSCKKFPDFKNNICKQLITFLNDQKDDQSFTENIFTHFTKFFYKDDPEMCKILFIREIVTPFLYFTYPTHKFNDEDITVKIKANSRVLHAVFAENISVPVDILQPIINVLFRFYVLTSETSLKTLNNDLNDILILFIEDQLKNYINIFDRLLFNLDNKEILPFRDNIIVNVTNNIIIKPSDHSVRYSSAENCECLFKLIKSKPKLLLKLFGYLLNCITNEQKYFQKVNEDLLKMEDDLTNDYFERKLAVYKLLTVVAEEKVVQKELIENPADVIDYINKVLYKTIEIGTHLLEDSDSEGFQSVFTILMILENLLTNSVKSKKFELLLEPLEKIYLETKNTEMKDIIKSILDILRKTNANKSKKIVTDVKTELDKAIDDICDALLPTRGHGLLTLTKLIEKKDKDTMDRKQFVLNMLQQNLTNKDSFIYLSAIKGLAAMADSFPDTILKILCDEYSDSNRKGTEDGAEVRMKLGEVLVKISKTLGEMAPKHKPLLLNTFLIQTKDDDELIRASSLSNLGEICRVLGYKLGTMFTEVLVCVHSIIATDKSLQARRAAVTVIRQLFIGLDQEIIVFFKDDILPVYRSLKHIYNTDTDDVMRLQAQLALEELNESMKNFVFPKPELNFDKKIVMLD